MILPQSLQTDLSRHHSITVYDAKTVSGGSINHAARLKTNRGNLFLKWNTSAPADMFEKEAMGLEILRDAETEFYIPEVLAFKNTRTDTAPGYLVMTYVEGQHGNEEISAAFGRQLARLHNHSESQFGLSHDNYIGSLAQSNSYKSTWTDFFAQERIVPQLKIAINTGTMDSGIMKHWQRLAMLLPDLFPKTKPSLLHGDLWGGNYFFDHQGRAVLIDPAVYYGHPEMELSFTKMFGGFSDAFYDAYAIENPLEPGFSERVPLYNLYPLLVHVNLFGGHYATQAASLLKQY